MRRSTRFAEEVAGNKNTLSAVAVVAGDSSAGGNLEELPSLVGVFVDLVHNEVVVGGHIGKVDTHHAEEIIHFFFHLGPLVIGFDDAGPAQATRHDRLDGGELTVRISAAVAIYGTEGEGAEETAGQDDGQRQDKDLFFHGCCVLQFNLAMKVKYCAKNEFGAG